MKALILVGVTLALCVPAAAQSAITTAPQSQLMPQNYHLFPSKNSHGAQLRTNKNDYRRGQAVSVAFAIRNTTKKPVLYDYPTAQQFNLTVSNAQGKVVWDWAKGRSFSPHITDTKLKPGQEKTYWLTWDGRNQQGLPVAPGSYTLKARMTSSNRPAITGNLVTDPTTDPQNMGVATRTPAENGVIRQVFVNPPLRASKTITIR